MDLLFFVVTYMIDIYFRMYFSKAHIEFINQYNLRDLFNHCLKCARVKRKYETRRYGGINWHLKSSNFSVINYYFHRAIPFQRTQNALIDTRA